MNLNYNENFQLQTIKSNENNMWVLQDCCTNSYESMVVYAPVDINAMQSVITGCDSSGTTILPLGFSIHQMFSNLLNSDELRIKAPGNHF